MKRKSDDRDALPPSSSRHRDSHDRPRRIPHLSLYQRRQHAPLEYIPRLATHYVPDAAIDVDGQFSANKHVALTATATASFPTTFLPSTVALIIDTGASVSITPEIHDFIRPPTPVQPTTLRGIAAGLQVRGIGCVHYHFPRPEGGVITVKLDNVLYVPDCLMRLLCPRHVAAATQQKGDGFTSLESHSILTCHGVSLHVEYEAKTKLPVIYSFTDQSNLTPLVAATAAKTSESDLTKLSSGMPAWLKPNLSQAQHLKLLMHEWCNHRHMADIFLFPHLLLVVQIQSAMHVSSEKLIDDLTIKQPEGLPLTPQLPARALVQVNWRQDVPVEFPPPRVFPPLNDTVTATYG
jgi:hypothetical protein